MAVRSAAHFAPASQGRNPEDQKAHDRLVKDQERLNNNIQETRDNSKQGADLAVRLARVEEKQKNAVPAHPKPSATVKVANDYLELAALEVLAEVARRKSGIPPAVTLERFVPGHANSMIRKAALCKIKGATNTGTTTAAGFGAELVGSRLMAFFEPMSAASVYGQIGVEANVLPFGRDGSVTFPRRAASGEGSLAASFVGENTTIPVKETTLGSTSITRHKLACISTVTNELVKTSSPEVVDLIKRWLIQDLATTLDMSMFNPTNASVAGIRPAAITHNATNYTSSGDTFTAIVADIKWLMHQFSAMKATKPTLCMHTDRVLGLQMVTDSQDKFAFREELLTSGTLFGLPVMHSPYMPADIVTGVDANALFMASDPIDVETGNAATIVMADDNTDPGFDPGMSDEGAVSVAGSIKVSDAADMTPAPHVVSTFQQNLTAIRLVAPLTWGMAAPNVAYLSGVNW